MNIISTINTEEEFQHYQDIGAEVLEMLNFDYELYNKITTTAISQKKSRNMVERRKQLLKSKYFNEDVNEFVQTWNDNKKINFNISNLNGFEKNTIDYLAKEPSITLGKYNLNMKDSVVGNINLIKSRIQTFSEIQKQKINPLIVTSQFYHLLHPEHGQFIDKAIKIMHEHEQKGDFLTNYVLDIIRVGQKIDLSKKMPFDIYTAKLGVGYSKRKIEVISK